MISMATPDYDRASLRLKWGYSFAEVPPMIIKSVDAHLGDMSRRWDVMLTHDWGALWGYYILEQLPRGRIGKLVAIDIGATTTPPQRGPINSTITTQEFLGEMLAPRERPTGALYALPYQGYFATVFFIGAALPGAGPTLASGLLQFGFWMHPLLGPLDWGFDWHSAAPRPFDEVEWWMCWPYFRLWGGVLGGVAPPTPRLPMLPTFFAYGTKKRTMFHSDAFAAQLSGRRGSRVVGYPCSHWVQHEHATQFNRDLKQFLDAPAPNQGQPRMSQGYGRGRPQ